MCMKNTLQRGEQIVLDVVRIIAATFVLFGHSFSFYQVTIFKDQSYFPYIQNIGVIIFFLLSGFLTTYSIEIRNKNNDYAFGSYVKHKVKRILRELLPALSIVATIDFIAILINKEKYQFYEGYNILQFIGNLFMLQNMGPRAILAKIFIPFGSARPLWTLSIEWWFYLSFVSIYLILANKEIITKKKALLLVLFAFMCSNYIITGRGNGLGFTFLLGVFSYYCYSYIKDNIAKTFTLVGIILYIIYGVVVKEAYTIYSMLILCFIFMSILKMSQSWGGGKKEYRFKVSFTRNIYVVFIALQRYRFFCFNNCNN